MLDPKTTKQVRAALGGVLYRAVTDKNPPDAVARIRGEMMKVIAQTGFKGSFDEFLTYLRTDPKSVEILGKYQTHLARVFKLMGRSESEAASLAKQVIEFETVIARKPVVVRPT